MLHIFNKKSLKFELYSWSALLVFARLHVYVYFPNLCMLRLNTLFSNASFSFVSQTAAAL